MGTGLCVTTGMPTTWETCTTCMKGASTTLSKSNWGVSMVSRRVWTLRNTLCVMTGMSMTLKRTHRVLLVHAGHDAEDLWPDDKKRIQSEAHRHQ